jgi:hypothetical protein
VLFHGEGLREPFMRAVKARGWAHSSLAQDSTGRLHELVGPQIRAQVLYLAHPARGHLNRQWSTAVEPSLMRLRQLGRLPA